VGHRRRRRRAPAPGPCPTPARASPPTAGWPVRQVHPGGRLHTRRGSAARAWGSPICDQLAALMGGSIQVQSRPGVRLDLHGEPGRTRIGEARSAAAGHRAPAPGGAPNRRAPIRVLAAEDNPVNQLVLKTLPASRRRHPVLVDNGALALEAWENQTWDLDPDGRRHARDGRPNGGARDPPREAAAGRARTPIIALTQPTPWPIRSPTTWPRHGRPRRQADRGRPNCSRRLQLALDPASEPTRP